ncbi:MAG: peptidyl-prolyl cis-trans isomerase [Aquificaceae bacterium]
MKVFFLFLLTLLSLSYADTVARIDDERVTKEEATQAFNAYWREILHLPMNQATKRDLQEFLVDYVRNRIIEKEAKKMGIKVTEGELKEYVSRNIGSTSLSSVVENFVKVEVIVNKIVDKVAKDLSITDKEITAYYYLNLRDFKLPSQVLVDRFVAYDLDTANEVYYRLLNGKDDLQDLRDVKVGTHMWYSLQTLPDVVKQQLYPYNVGKVSRPISIPGGGYMILKIKDRRGGGILSLDEAKPLVRERLMKEKRQEVFRQWFQEVSKDYHVEFYFGQL